MLAEVAKKAVAKEMAAWLATRMTSNEKAMRLVAHTAKEEVLKKKAAKEKAATKQEKLQRKASTMAVVAAAEPSEVPEKEAWEKELSEEGGIGRRWCRRRS